MESASLKVPSLKKRLHLENASSHLSLNKTHVMNVGSLLGSAHFTSPLQHIVSCWTFSASVFKAVSFRGPKLLKDQVPGSHLTQQIPFSAAVTFLYQWHLAAQEMGLGSWAGPDQKDMRTDHHQQLPLFDPFPFWHYTLHFTQEEKMDKMNKNTSVFLGKDRYKGVNRHSKTSFCIYFLSQKALSNHIIEWGTGTWEKHKPKHNHRQ